jgi:hypothetical protein
LSWCTKLKVKDVKTKLKNKKHRYSALGIDLPLLRLAFKENKGYRPVKDHVSHKKLTVMSSIYSTYIQKVFRPLDFCYITALF